MRIKRFDDQSLLIVDFPYIIGAVTLPLSLFLLYQIGTRIVAPPKRQAELVGCIVAFLVTFLIGCFFVKRSVFEFDRGRRKLTWSRMSIFGRSGGIIPFDDIEAANIQSTSSSDSGTTYRVALKTAGGIVPLTQTYSSQEPCKRVRDAIEQVLELSTPTSVEDDILELAIAGRKIDAIKLARLRYNFGLAEAKQFVEGLQK